MRLPIFIAAVLVLSSGGCRATTNLGMLPTDDGLEKAVDSEKGLQQPDAVVIALESEHMPSIIGGMNAIRKNLNYPQDALDAGIEGRVFVKFIVDEEGYPHQVEIYSGLCTSCDAEAIRLIEQTRIIPGAIGRLGVKTPVAMLMSLPVEFRLPPN